MFEGSWTPISAEDYRASFDRFGGSFATHPRVVALVADLAGRSMGYSGLKRGGQIVAAVAHWDAHVAATKACLNAAELSHLIDIGDSEVVLPVAPDVAITVPFIAETLSEVHRANVLNLERDMSDYPPEMGVSFLMIAKTGENRQSSKTRHERERLVRRFAEIGGNFRPIQNIQPEEVARIFIALYEKRHNEPPLGAELLPRVLTELKDLLGGAILFLQDRPIGMELAYKNPTPRWLLVNGVQRALDLEFLSHSAGTLLTFHNNQMFQAEAEALGKELRYCFGWNDEPYKKLWAKEVPAFRLTQTSERHGRPSSGDFARSLVR